MTTKLNVEGMSCAHCEKAVKKAVLQIKGVKKVLVDLTAKTVEITHDETVTPDIVKSKIEEQGYEIVD